jgi:hypothetical protein
MLALVTLGLVAGLAPAAWAASGGSGPSTGATAERVPVCSAEPAGVAHCLAIQLLHSATNWHGAHLPHAVRGRSPSGKLDTGGASPAASEATPSGYLPAELQSAYGLASTSASAGATETVAVVDAYDDPNAEVDLAKYRSYSNLAACTTANGCFAKVDQQGGSSYPRADIGWAEEISLDLDMVSAICPNCHILLVEANSSSLTDLGTAVNEAVKLGANAISNSYAGAEFSNESEYDQYYAHAGVAITASAGDSGYGVEYPASSPFVTAVGGTTLAPAATTRGWNETVWSETGSGCSAYEPGPEWQPMTSECAKRAVADVAADANPNTGVAVYDSFHLSGWLVFGGTSVSSPIVASVYALAGGTSSFTVSSAGSDAAKGFYTDSSLLNKVTSGANASGCSVYLCNAADSLFSDAGHEYFGYNGPTGNGTPNGVSGFMLSPAVSTSPQGSWVGAYGSAGYDLAAWGGSSDLADIPGATVALLQGGRYVWASSTIDPRALESPDKSTREAAAYFNGSEIRLRLSFTAAYKGELRLYALDWDSRARRESISVAGQTAYLSGDFHEGAWVSVPIEVAAGESLTVTVKRIAGVNAVLSGVFLGGAGAPPS